MKTKIREKKLAEFKLQFEKQRRDNVVDLRIYIPLYLLMALVLCFFFWFMLFKMMIPGLAAHDPRFIILIIPLCLIVALIYCALIGLPSEFIAEYNIQTIIKNPKEKLKSLNVEKENLIAKLEIAKEMYRRQSSLLSWIQNDCVRVITPEPMWVNYIIAIADDNYNQIKEMEKTIRSLNPKIIDLEIRLEVYYQTVEQTLWQYIWSRKWLKKLP